MYVQHLSSDVAEGEVADLVLILGQGWGGEGRGGEGRGREGRGWTRAELGL